jgi:hypothetical protein
LLAQFLERSDELRTEQGEVALDALGAPDHHMIGAGEPVGGEGLAGKRSKAALHSVPNHRAADLLRNGETDAHRWVLILAIADEQDETGRSRAQAAVRGKEVGALLDGC